MKTRTTGYVVGVLFLISMPPLALGAVRRSSVATASTGGVGPSSFCTVDGRIQVVHSCPGADPANYSRCSFGQTLLTGASTQRLGAGSHSIPSGCYQHSIANTTVTGAATAKSTVWYDSNN